MSELDRDRPSDMPMNDGEVETLKRIVEESRRLVAEELLFLTKPLKKVEEKPDPKTLEMVHKRFDYPARIAALEVENEILRKDLELTRDHHAALLARQTALAREAGIRAMLAEGELRPLNFEARGMLEFHGYWHQNFESAPALGIIAQFGALVEKLKAAEVALERIASGVLLEQQDISEAKKTLATIRWEEKR